MLHNHRVAVVLPAFNAEKTLRRTFDDIPHDIVDDVILTDDASSDQTVEVARELGIFTVTHQLNMGYGGNQKTCYSVALSRGADIVIMLHPDYQYAPRLVTAMASMIASGEYDVVLGSRILGNGARKGGMPLYKYVSNRILTLVQNLMVDRSCPSFTAATGLGIELCSRGCRCTVAPMTLCLIIKCWYRQFPAVSKSEKYPVPPDIFLRRHPSISGAVLFMGWAYWTHQCPIVFIAGE